MRVLSVIRYLVLTLSRFILIFAQAAHPAKLRDMPYIFEYRQR